MDNKRRDEILEELNNNAEDAHGLSVPVRLDQMNTRGYSWDEFTKYYQAYLKEQDLLDELHGYTTRQ